MKKILLSFAVLLGFGLQKAMAQQITCGVVDNAAQKQEVKALNEAILKAKAMAINAKTKLKTPNTFSGPVNGNYTVPVVFHIAHAGQALGTPGNPSDAQIIQYLDLLNRAFSNTYDAGQGFNSAPTKIRFALAKKTPTNGNTTGIYHYDLSGNPTYVQSGLKTTSNGAGITTTELYAATGYLEGNNYLNFYIVTEFSGGTDPSSGYSSGSRIRLKANLVPTSALIAHEVGHSFGLDHTFQGSSGSTCPVNTDCTVDGDGVCDTPPVANVPCFATGNNPCTGMPWGGVQYNFMSNLCSVDRFSPGQVAKMELALNTINSGYKNSSGDQSPGVLPRVIAPPTIRATSVNNDFRFGPQYVSFNSIELPSASYEDIDGYRDYVDYTAIQATTVVAGATYPVSFTSKFNRQGIKMFIDFNNDGVFGTTAPEMVFFQTMTASEGSVVHTYTGSVTIPATGVTFNTPLRMRVVGDTYSGSFDPIGTLTYGQAEDYTVYVTGTLPISLGEAKAYTQNNRLYVNWTTASEQNVERFDVQVSSDGTNFKTVGSVKSQAENGNSSTALKYSFENNMNGSGTLMISLLSLGSILLFSIRNRKKYLMLGMFALVSTVAIISCKKTEKMDAQAGSTYVRIAQVDKDGKINYLPTITVTKK